MVGIGAGDDVLLGALALLAKVVVGKADRSVVGSGAAHSEEDFVETFRRVLHQLFGKVGSRDVTSVGKSVVVWECERLQSECDESSCRVR